MFLPDRTHRMLILLNFAQKSLSFHPTYPWHLEEYSPMMLGSPVDPLVLRPDIPDDQPGVLEPAPAPAVVHEVPVRVPGVVAVMLTPPLHPVT